MFVVNCLLFVKGVKYYQIGQILFTGLQTHDINQNQGFHKDTISKLLDIMARKYSVTKISYQKAVIFE